MLNKNDSAGRPSHHIKKGFRNPFPGFFRRKISHRVKWFLFEHRKNVRLLGGGPFNLKTVHNDGTVLGKNKTDFTITWVGHSTTLIQLDGLNILTDPVWSYRVSPLRFAGPRRYSSPGIAFEDLPKIHIVLITHNHYEHLDIKTVKALGNSPFYLVPLGVGKILANRGITNFRELDWWESYSFKKINFVCTPAQHFSGRGIFDRDKTLWCGWAAKGNTGSFYFAGDTAYFPGFREIGDKYGPIDLVLMPIGAYLPRRLLSPIHVSPDEAVQAFLDLRGKLFVPVHWGTFKLADDPLHLPPMELMKEAEKQGLNPVNFLLLSPGETFNITKLS